MGRHKHKHKKPPVDVSDSAVPAADTPADAPAPAAAPAAARAKLGWAGAAAVTLKEAKLKALEKKSGAEAFRSAAAAAAVSPAKMARNAAAALRQANIDADLSQLINLGMKLTDVEGLWGEAPGVRADELAVAGERLLEQGGDVLLPSRASSLASELLRSKRARLHTVLAKLKERLANPPSHMVDPVSKTLMADPSQSTTSNDQSDHGDVMKRAFKQYAKVPSKLGHVLELGCGPYTQLREILSVPGRGWTMDSVTLADPILVFESKHKNSAFHTGKFVDRKGKIYPTTLHQVGAEAVGGLYHDAFDTVIMMNVLEHVASAYEVLESLYNATKPGGIVVLWEPAYSPSWAGWKERGDELLLDTSLPISPSVRNPEWSDVSVRTSPEIRADTVSRRGLHMTAGTFSHRCATLSARAAST
jgi:SAM-dependent methyltransferase